MKRFLSTVLALGVFLTASGTSHAAGGTGAQIGKELPLWTVVPFVVLLLAIAILPLVWKKWEKSNTVKGYVAAGCGILPFIYFAWRDYNILVHTGVEYFSFIVLLLSLFVISGGIFINGDIRATPRVNTFFLLIGAILANLIGTTGAAMLLIRPVLRTNQERKNTKHIPVFFIFLVANVGGSLLPIGDPPLFLGFLKGVPFFWTLNLFWPWAMAVALILGVFFIWDVVAYAGESKKAIELDQSQIEPIKLHGRKNIPLLVGVVIAVASLPSIHLPAAHWYGYVPWREIVMLALTALSVKLTPCPKKDEEGELIQVPVGHPRYSRTKNEFSLHAINEVAVLFAGIFAAMIPALLILQAHGGELPVREAWHYFLATGTLSAFLDNAPTYLTFFSLAQGQGYAGADAVQGISPAVLQGISLGAVFMGAMSYIGNAPNFMVKAITEEKGLKMPSFGGYLMWAICILLPIYAVVNVVFLGLADKF